MRHSDFFADEPCKGELVAVESDRILTVAKGHRVFWCTLCGAEFQYQPGSEWVKVIYRGCVDSQ
jgi:hypothetical protein